MFKVKLGNILNIEDNPFINNAVITVDRHANISGYFASEEDAILANIMFNEKIYPNINYAESPNYYLIAPGIGIQTLFKIRISNFLKIKQPTFLTYYQSSLTIRGYKNKNHIQLIIHLHVS